MAAAVDDKNLRVGMVASIQTFSDNLDWNPHLHCFVSRGVWLASGQWIPVPYIDTHAAEILFREKVYVITKTHRFKAAISGASETNFLACYGTDHYQLQWEKELGLPWENRELYLKLSPITYVANIETPTLILSGEVDWNIPVGQGEQLYQSLRRRGIDTTLVVYPGQSHGIRKPSYQKDRYQRYLAWFDRLLKDGEATSTPTPQP